ncbi:helix-turn-helix transcriptional regulator [Burkholderia sp. PR2]|uniref:helix-turn-helix transcriptional regulator n=1 Tax=Burkholderia sp. PR2 TaxID=3448078 RepID=UPI00402AF79C
MTGVQGLAVIKRQQVEELTGLRRSSIYARMQAGTFPRAVKLGQRAVAWRVADVEAWLRDPAGWSAPGALAASALGAAW